MRIAIVAVAAGVWLLIAGAAWYLMLDCLSHINRRLAEICEELQKWRHGR